MSPALKRVPPLPGTHPYFKGSACVLVLPGNSCKPFFTALSSVSHELVEVYGVIPANSSCMKHWEPTDAMEQVWHWGLLAQLEQCFILGGAGLQESGILTHLEYHSTPPVNFILRIPLTLPWTNWPHIQPVALMFKASFHKSSQRYTTTNSKWTHLEL